MSNRRVETIRFKNDTSLRRRLFDPASFAHPAKGHTGMWQLMIERYSQPGDTVLDPMAGTGVTLLAALMGRNVMCVELEHHFLLPMARSWAKMRTSPMLGFEQGEVQILWGDARRLADVQPWPYRELAVQCTKDSWETLRARRRKYHLALAPWSLPLASADCIVTSPPWQNIDAQVSADKFADPVGFAEISSLHYRDGTRAGHFASKEAILRNLEKQQAGYTRPPQVDAIVTSPPYEGTRQDGGRLTQVLEGSSLSGSYTGEASITWGKCSKGISGRSC